VGWREVAVVLRAVTPAHLVLLAAVWLGGLGIYSLVLSAALPGLGIRRSLLLNLSGSAVANVLPLGGAVATAMNWRMVRIWGHSNPSFVSFCVLTNVLDVLTKLALPLVGVAALATVSVHVPLPLWWLADSCAGVLALVVLGQAVVVRWGDVGAGDPGDRTSWLRRLRDPVAQIRGLFVASWTRLVSGSLGYVAAQVALLFFSLRAVGLQVPVSAVVMAAAIERLCTLVPLTPGGTGVAEVGTIAFLVATGLDPVDVVAGVLLYRVFLIAMEIPLGGALLGVWVWLQRASRVPTVDGVTG
jgi:uncharacterized membrane protein YbhN (UPF0104 family)